MRLFAHFTAAAALFGASLAAGADYNLPSIGQPADNVMSPAEEERIGERVVGQLMERGLILEDPELTEYLTRVGWRLAEHTDRPPTDFHFFVIDDERVNAFALPGGYIGINAGLITESETESELAGVVAHEIAHVTQRHIARQIQATQGLTWVTAAAMLLAIIAGGGDPSVVQAALTMGMSNLGQQQINFTRQHELEADRLGIRTLARAHYNPNGMSGFFHKMERRSRLYGNRLPEILLTHPVSDTRIAEAESRARNYRVESVRESEEYPLMRARTRVLASRRPSEAVTYFEEKRRRTEHAEPAAEYGYALALSRIGRLERALEVIEPLADGSAANPHFVLAYAQMLSDNGDVAAALDVLENLESRYPSYLPLNLAYADVLIANDQASRARSYLMGKSGITNSHPEVNRLLARAADQAGRRAEAHYRQARYQYLRGNYPAAIFRLETALKLPDLQPDDKARIQATLRQYRDQCEEQRSEKECERKVRQRR